MRRNLKFFVPCSLLIIVSAMIFVYTTDLSRLKKRSKVMSSSLETSPIISDFFEDDNKPHLKLSSQQTNNLTFDESCDRHGDWESIGNSAFFKRTGSFYFMDAKLLHMLLIKKVDTNFTFSLNLFLYKKDGDSADYVELGQKRISPNEMLVRKHTAFYEYNFSVITVSLDLDSYLANRDLRNIKVAVFVDEILSGAKSQSSMNVKLKNLTNDYSLKRGAMICSKCVHLKNHFDFLSLRWWIELNREAGYDKLHMCDHQIEDEDSSFKDLFEKNQDFVELGQLRCLPNLQKNKETENFKYLKHFSSLKSGMNYAVLKFELILQVYTNECYLNNIDKYRYVAVIDNDELVLPRKTKNFFKLNEVNDYISNLSWLDKSSQAKKNAVFSDIKCNRYQINKVIQNKQEIESYLNEISNLAELKRPLTIYSHMAFYIYNSLVEKIFLELEKTLKMPSTLKAVEKFENVTFIVNDFNIKPELNNSFTFIFNTPREFEYAKNLLGIYRDVIEPYLKKNEDLIASSTYDYDRIFYVAGRNNHFACGKSIHDSRNAFDFSVHYIENTIRVAENGSISIGYNAGYWEKYNQMDDNLVHVSHFRRDFSYLSAKYQPLPIEFFRIDLNYLNCYFVPMLERISKYSA